jgi:hypothetical protein
MKRLVLALLLVAAAPAFAADFPYSTFGVELEAEDGLDDAVALAPEPGFFDKVDLAGGMQIALDRTSIYDLTDAFGNAPQTYQRVGYTTVWLCYTDAGRRVWYMADLTYETTDDIKISIIVDEPADPATDDLFLCLPEAKAMLAKQASLPVVGATRTDLEARFKATVPPGTRHAFASKDNSEVEGVKIYDMKTVYYRLKGDVVDAISIAEDYMDEDEETE